MGWSAHGKYSLHWDGDCLCMVFAGEWNEVTALALAAEMRELMAARAGLPWSLMSDAADWEGATPEAMRIVWEMFVPLREQGMVSACTVLPRGFQEVVIRPLIRQARTMTRYRAFHTRGEAMAWSRVQAAEAFLSAQPR